MSYCIFFHSPCFFPQRNAALAAANADNNGDKEEDATGKLKKDLKKPGRVARPLKADSNLILFYSLTKTPCRMT